MMQRLRGLSIAARSAIIVCLAVVVIILALLGEYAMITANYNHADQVQRISIAHANQVQRSLIAQSKSDWCDTLDLLTKTPVPKPADPSVNPSRVQDYLLYEDFVHIKIKFGCK
jgi:hypothetical protein